MPWKPSRAEDVPPFMCVSCHDWACNCRSPYTINRYTFGHTPRAPGLGSTVYERGHMVPHGCQLDKNNKLVARFPRSISIQNRIRTAENPENDTEADHARLRSGQLEQGGALVKESNRNKFLKQKQKLSANQPPPSDTYSWSLSKQPHTATSSGASNATWVKSEEPTSDEDFEDDMEMKEMEKKFNSPKMMEAILASKPVSMKSAFLVSGPHWCKKTLGHGQQWPWRGSVTCRLWSTTNKYNHQGAAVCHKGACWDKGKRVQTARV